MCINIWNKGTMSIKKLTVTLGGGRIMRKFNFVTDTFLSKCIFTVCKNYLDDTKMKATIDIIRWVALNSLTSCYYEEACARTLSLVVLFPSPHGRLLGDGVGGMEHAQAGLFFRGLPARERPHAEPQAAIWSGASPKRDGAPGCSSACVCESVPRRGQVWQAQLHIILTPHSPVSFWLKGVTGSPLISLPVYMCECVWYWIQESKEAINWFLRTERDLLSSCCCLSANTYLPSQNCA